MRRNRTAWLLVVALAGVAAGGLAGFLARRHADGGDPGAPRARAPAIDAALRAWADGDTAGVQAFLATLSPTTLAGPTDRAEVAFLAAALDADDDAMAAVVTRWPDTDAAGRAAWWRVVHAPDEEARARRLASFAERWPEAWVLEQEDGARR